MDSLRGQILIASAGLLDPNFARSVVLIAVHGEEGALGLILNREMSLPIRQVWSQVSEAPCERDENARQGGPVGGSLLALHDQRPMANMIVTDLVYLATEIADMERLAGSNEGRVLFYIGHSGWGPGQLEREIADGSWLTLAATPDHVFGDREPITLWQETMIEVGRGQMLSIMPIKHPPEDPRVN